MQLLAVKQFPVENLPTKKTIYKWHSLKKYPKLIIKIGSQLFFDLQEWENMAISSRDSQVLESQRVWG